jgi:hypothetical protein
VCLFPGVLSGWHKLLTHHCRCCCCCCCGCSILLHRLHTISITFLAGVRWLLFRCPGDTTTRYPNHFSHKPDAPAHVRELIVGSYARTGSYSIAPLGSRSSSNSSMACSESSSVEDAAVAPVDAQVVFAAEVEGWEGDGAGTAEGAGVNGVEQGGGGSTLSGARVRRILQRLGSWVSCRGPLWGPGCCSIRRCEEILL